MQGGEAPTCAICLQSVVDEDPNSLLPDNFSEHVAQGSVDFYFFLWLSEKETFSFLLLGWVGVGVVCFFSGESPEALAAELGVSRTLASRLEAVRQRNIMMTPCGHVFCSDCLGIWMQHKLECPSCRAQLPEVWFPLPLHSLSWVNHAVEYLYFSFWYANTYEKCASIQWQQENWCDDWKNRAKKTKIAIFLSMWESECAIWRKVWYDQRLSYSTAYTRIFPNY